MFPEVSFDITNGKTFFKNQTSGLALEIWIVLPMTAHGHISCSRLGRRCVRKSDEISDG